MLEPEKLRNRGKQGWPDAGKGTEHKGDKKVNTLVKHKWTPIEQPNALGCKQRQGKNVSSIMHRAAERLRREEETLEARQERRLLQLAQERATMPSFTSTIY